jgi:hypothetical protein
LRELEAGVVGERGLGDRVIGAGFEKASLVVDGVEGDIV